MERKSVTINEKPRLCGATCFALILDAKVEAMNQREHWKGHKDKRVIPNLMSRLLWVMNGETPDLKGKALETFGSNVNKYRLCKIEGGAHVRLKKTDSEVQAFDNMVRNDYQTVLKRMDAFLWDVLDFREEVGKPESLVKALMDTVSQDRHCDNKEFFVLENGDSIPGCEVSALTEVCLPAFVLGMWHAALMIPDRKKDGEATINEWCPSTGGGHRDYSGSVGKVWPVEVKVNGMTVTELSSTETEEVDQPDDEPQKDETEDTEYRQPGGPQLNQFLAKPKANVHYGSGDIYSDIGTLNITKNYYGGKDE